MNKLKRVTKKTVTLALLGAISISTVGFAVEHSRGKASYYSYEFANRKTANGERFKPEGLTAAHKTLKFGTYLNITNLSNGRSVIVRVNDRGPYKKGRILDLSLGAAKEIGMIKNGTANIKIEVVDNYFGDS